jgi:hypothetical protein
MYETPIIDGPIEKKLANTAFPNFHFSVAMA